MDQVEQLARIEAGLAMEKRTASLAAFTLPHGATPATAVCLAAARLSIDIPSRVRPGVGPQGRIPLIDACRYAAAEFEALAGYLSQGVEQAAKAEFEDPPAEDGLPF